MAQAKHYVIEDATQAALGYRVGTSRGRSTMALFSDPALMTAVAGGLAFLIALKVVAFIAVRKVMRGPVRKDDREEQ